MASSAYFWMELILVPVTNPTINCSLLLAYLLKPSHQLEHQSKQTRLVQPKLGVRKLNCSNKGTYLLTSPHLTSPSILGAKDWATTSPHKLKKGLRDVNMDANLYLTEACVYIAICRCRQ